MVKQIWTCLLNRSVLIEFTEELIELALIKGNVDFIVLFFVAVALGNSGQLLYWEVEPVRNLLNFFSFYWQLLRGEVPH